MEGREKAVKEIHGDESQQIRMLHSYCLQLKKSNPGSNIILQLENQVFKSMYVCIDSLKKGFKSCRPIICVDGTWLKGVFGGQLLTAVGIDANDFIYPISWTVVQVENRVNWTWFLKLLAEDLGIDRSCGWTFMLDRQKVM